MMRTKHSYFSIFNSRLIVVALMLVTSCNLSPKKDTQQQTPTVAVVDSTLSEQIGSENPEWKHKLDSMLQIAATAKEDTNLALLYYQIGDMYFDINSQQAKEYYLKVKTLSEKLDWNSGRYKFAAAYTDVLNRQGLMDSSIIIHQQALELAKKEKNELQIAKISVNIGNCYNYKQWYETALNYYNQALPIFEKRQDKYRVAYLYNLMSVAFRNINMADEQLKYAEKAVGIYNEKPDTLSRAHVLINYAVALLDSRQLNKAEKCLLEAKRITLLHNSRYNLLVIYTNLGDVSLQKYDLNKMEMYTRKTLEIATEFGDVEGFCISNRSFGYIEEYRGNFDQSEKYAKMALDTAIAYDLPVEKMKCYALLEDLSTARHDFHNYRVYAFKRDSVQNIIVTEQTQRAVKEMEVKYETEKKELKITALEKEKRLMTGFGIAISVIFLLALATFFLLWRWITQKKRLAEQHVKQLEQEKQLLAIQAVLEGEVQERFRLARDLHDGLGSMLTGTKYSLLKMKKDVVLGQVDMERFDKVLELLDDSVREMRRVAHHLMPDSLSRFGLKSAVNDFCSNLPSVRFVYYGDELRLDSKLEIMIYRSIHELVNNALKYSGANTIIVQIIQESDRISFTVQDDGCGFDPSAETKGMGLQNIRNRMASYNGVLDIHSKAGEGTEVNVELKIEN